MMGMGEMLARLEAAAHQRVQALCAGRWGWLRAALVIYGCSLVMAGPQLERLHLLWPNGLEGNQSFVYGQKMVSPLMQINAGPNNHDSMLTFRITNPLVARLLHLNVWHMTVLEIVLGLPFILLLMRLFDRCFNDRAPAFYSAAAMAFSYPVLALTCDIDVFWDGWNLWWMLLAMVVPWPPAIVLFTVMAAFGDERAALAMPIVFAWHWHWHQYAKWRGPHDRVEPESPPSLSISYWRRLLAPGSRHMAVAWGLLLALGIRLYLMLGVGLYLPVDGSNSVGLISVGQNLPWLALGWFFTFEALWVYWALALAWLAWRRQWAHLFWLLVPAGISIGASALIFDITRSAGYAWPVTVLAAAWLGQSVSRAGLRRLCLWAALLCFLIPACNVFGGHIEAVRWYRPLPIKLAHWLKPSAH